jgi:ribosomal protein S18 acetylase RimI-like enzyme
MDPQAPSFRQANGDDRDFCWRLHRQAMRAYVDATWGWDETEQRRRFDESFDPALVRIIVVDGNPVGALKLDTGGVPIRLVSIAIRPQYQRRGYGTAVISHVLQEAAGAPVWLQVLKVNPARALYERLGFVVTVETTTHWQMMRGPSA